MSALGLPMMPPTLPPAGAPAAAPSRQMPKPGDVVNFHRFMGGDPGNDASWQPLSGQEYLAAIPPARANIVKAIINGRAPLPNSRASKPDAFSNQLLQDVAMAEPGFDGTVWKARNNLRADFGSGKSSIVIRALNQAPLHAKELSTAFDDLHNTNYSFLNKPLTNLEAGFGSTQQQAARGAFNENQPAVAGELASVYKGGYATEPDIASQTKAFDMGLAPAESNAALAKAATLMEDRLTQLNQQWESTMGPLADKFPVMGPRAAEALGYLKQKYVDGATAAVPQPKPAVKPATKPTNGGWTVKRVGQ